MEFTLAKGFILDTRTSNLLASRLLMHNGIERAANLVPRGRDPFCQLEVCPGNETGGPNKACTCAEP